MGREPIQPVTQGGNSSVDQRRRGLGDDTHRCWHRTCSSGRRGPGEELVGRREHCRTLSISARVRSCRIEAIGSSTVVASRAGPGTASAAAVTRPSATGELWIVNHLRFGAMGTTVDGWVEGDTRELPAWFEEVESRCSRFRPTSELSLINQSGGGRLEMSPLMFDVLEAASRARRLSDGLVDVGVGKAVAEWGYAVTFEDVDDVDHAPPPIAPGEWRLEGSSLWLQSGTQIDLGGIAKGWACDRAVEEGLAAVVSAGGDMRSDCEETITPIVDCWGDVVARVAVNRGGVATSSVVGRRWRVGSREVSHIVDPRSMTPVESPVLSMTVVAASAVDAETAAKTALIHGVDGLAWADSQEWIRAALAVWHDGSVYATRGMDWAA